MRSALWAHCLIVYPTIILLLNKRVRQSENSRVHPNSDMFRITSKGFIYWLLSQLQPERDTHNHAHSHTHTCAHTRICIIHTTGLIVSLSICLCRLLLEHHTQGVSQEKKYSRCDWCLNTTKFCTQPPSVLLSKVWLTFYRW
jgi:hypothetical protein